ncbi:multiheme c-type cytochrome [Geobacter sp. SVR]|uniref:multiheme c-type cytochrome n=1 Tax=Geobacter sp. SVR TaxID=2495594 RepID=UPI00143EFF1A|nr:multiheme c-type cytochrome [Geobacter sp. SVR]BCS53449.1 cytochrome c [Geobacter sp. SVR]GCF85424.1 cytochrome c [Geobacter sp. SVR]
MALKALVALVVMASMAHAAAEHPVFPVDRDFYPYYPSLMRWEKTAAPFTPPEVCGGCHQTQHREWNGSVHQLAFQDPVYQGELNKAVKAVGHEVSRQCEGCHSPIGVLTGEVKQPGLAGLSSLGMNGVSCDICHSISSVTHTRTPAGVPENGSFVLRPGEDGKDGPVLVKRGPNKPSEGCGGGFHSCEQSPLITKADLCASCHQVYHYEAHFPLEATYNEWKQGPYAQKNIHCQDCHMVATATFKRSADEFKKPAKGEYRHYFNGANYLLYYLASAAAKKAGDEALAANLAEKYLMAIDRLKAAAGMEIMPVYRDGTLAEIKIRVKNIRAGHNLPTSLTNVRQMWLEVTARDEGGKVLFTSGSVKPDGSLPDNVRIFNSEGMGNDFHFSVDPWVITAFSRHETIPPRGYKDVYYGISPSGKSGKVSVEAKLRYRQADQAVAEGVLGAVPRDIDLKNVYGLDTVPPLPVVDMVVQKGVFAVNAK